MFCRTLVLAWCCCFVGGDAAANHSAIAAQLVEDFEQRFPVNLSTKSAAGLNEMMVDELDLYCSPQVFLRLGYEITFGTGLYAEAIADHLAANSGDQISFKYTDLLTSFTYGLSTDAFATFLPTGVSGDGMLVDASGWTNILNTTQLMPGCSDQEQGSTGSGISTASSEPVSALLVSYRRDVLAALGTPVVPDLWEDLLTWAQEYGGLVAAARATDPTLSFPKYPICIDSSPGCKASFILTAMAAAYIHSSENACTGVYFDPVNMQPLSSNEAMDRVLYLYSALVALSAPPPTSCRNWSPSFYAGECAMTIDFSTIQKSQKFPNMSSLVGTSFLPGTTSFLNRTTNKLIKQANRISFAPQPAWKVLYANDVCGTIAELRLIALRAAVKRTWGAWANLVKGTSPNENKAAPPPSAPPFLSPSVPLSAPPAPEATVQRRALTQYSFDLVNFTKAGYDRADMDEYLGVYWGALLGNETHLVDDISIQGAPYYRQCYDIAAQSATTSQDRSMIMGMLENCVMAVLDSSGDRTDLMLNYWASLGWRPDGSPYMDHVDPPPPKSNTAMLVVSIVVPIVAVGILSLLAALFVYRWRGQSAKYRSMFGAVLPPRCGANTTLVVTDIAGSTMLWEAFDAELMDRALNVHHDTIRGLLDTFKGYESATEGDSFILAFHVPEDAVNFSAACQLGLKDAPWPEELLKHPNCAVEWRAVRGAQFPICRLSETVKEIVHLIPIAKGPCMVPIDVPSLTHNALNRLKASFLKVTGKAAPINYPHSEDGVGRHFYSHMSSLPMDLTVDKRPSDSRMTGGAHTLMILMPSDATTGVATEQTMSLKSYVTSGASTHNGSNSEVGISALTDAYVFEGPKASTSILRTALTQQFRRPKPSLWNPMSPCEMVREGHAIAFRGMRVRMGIHSMGADLCKEQTEYNQATGRVQYSGTFLLKAKAVEDAAQSGGQVVISESTAQRLNMASAAKSLLILNMGEHLLSDELGGKCSLYQMQPYALTCRLPSFEPLRTSALLSPSVLDAPVGVVTIVFCNVQGAQTLLRSSIVNDARKSLHMFHEAVNRETISTGGYIVELVDGLALAAFPTPGQALLWSLRLRQACLELDYPPALLEHELCEEIKVMVPSLDQPSHMRSRLLLRGLRIKFGIDTGKLQDSINVATGRMAYRGRSMNRAARIGVRANPGQVLCSSHVWNAAVAHASEVQSEIIATSLGLQSYKGVATKVEVMECSLRGASFPNSDMLASILKQRGELCGGMLGSMNDSSSRESNIPGNAEDGGTSLSHSTTPHHPPTLSPTTPPTHTPDTENAEDGGTSLSPC